MNTKSLLTLAITGLSSLSLVHGELKFATVDMNKLFEAYHKTETAQKGINEERARVQQENDARLVKIREIETAIKDLRKKLDDPSLGDEKKKELAKKFEEQRQEGIALDSERREFIKRRNAALVEKTRQDMKVILDEINELIEISANADNYDYVFNKTAVGANQVPFLLYSKDAVDITEKLSATLNEGAPASE